MKDIRKKKLKHSLQHSYIQNEQELAEMKCFVNVSYGSRAKKFSQIKNKQWTCLAFNVFNEQRFLNCNEKDNDNF